MKTKIILSIIIVTVLFLGLSFTAFSGHGSRCPSNTIPAPGVNPTQWVRVCTTIPLTINGITCDYSICYCYRISGITHPYVEIFIDPHGTNVIYPCEHLYPPGNTELLFKELIKLNPHSLPWPCPPCDWDPYYEYKFYKGACYYPGTTEECFGTEAYCIVDYYLCCDEYGVKHVTKGDQTNYGTCAPGCEINCFTE